MKNLFIENEFMYDGTQLRPLYAYEKHGIQGHSIISWIGGCDIPFEHMVDYEDKLEKSEIRGKKMLHFIIEVFDFKLISAVFMQRLFSSIVKDVIEKKSSQDLVRKGDDLFWQINGVKRKLTISIASVSAVSSMVHFAININNENTPVETCSLDDLKIEAKSISLQIMKEFVDEYLDVVVATQKVKPL